MAVPSGVSLQESPSWKGGHSGRGAAGPRARSAPAGFPGDRGGRGARCAARTPPAAGPPPPRRPPGRRPGAPGGSPALEPHPQGSRGFFKSRGPPSVSRRPGPASRTPPRRSPETGPPPPPPSPAPGTEKAPDGRRQGPRRRDVPTCRRLCAPRSAEGIAGSSTVTDPGWFPRGAGGWVVRVRFRPGSGSRPQREFNHSGRRERR